MPYLDSEQKFYDYRTKDFDGKNPFDKTKTGISFYNQFLTDPNYMEDHKNLKHSIVEMSPMEYFAECAKIFNSTTNKQIDQISRDINVIQHLKDVLLKYKKTFPITFLNYAEDTQEGRHRMYVVGELMGWNKKFPVMIIDWADPLKEKQRKIAHEKDKENRIISYIDKITNELLLYDYDNVEEVIKDFKWHLNIKFSNVGISYSNNILNFNIDGVEYKVPIWKFSISNLQIEDESYEEILSELKRVGLY